MDLSEDEKKPVANADTKSNMHRLSYLSAGVTCKYIFNR